MAEGHGTAADYWALGCLTYEMVTGSSPWLTGDPLNDTELAIYVRISAHKTNKLKFPSDVNLTKPLKSFLNDTIAPRPTKRLGFDVNGGGDARLRHHPWFSGFRWTELASGKMGAPHAAQTAKCMKDALDACDVLDLSAAPPPAAKDAAPQATADVNSRSSHICTDHAWSDLALHAPHTHGWRDVLRAKMGKYQTPQRLPFAERTIAGAEAASAAAAAESESRQTTTQRHTLSRATSRRQHHSQRLSAKSTRLSDGSAHAGSLQMIKDRLTHGGADETVLAATFDVDVTMDGLEDTELPEQATSPAEAPTAAAAAPPVAGARTSAGAQKPKVPSLMVEVRTTTTQVMEGVQAIVGDISHRLSRIGAPPTAEFTAPATAAVATVVEEEDALAAREYATDAASGASKGAIGVVEPNERGYTTDAASGARKGSIGAIDFNERGYTTDAASGARKGSISGASGAPQGEKSEVLTA